MGNIGYGTTSTTATLLHRNQHKSTTIEHTVFVTPYNSQHQNSQEVNMKEVRFLKKKCQSSVYPVTDYDT